MIELCRVGWSVRESVWSMQSGVWCRFNILILTSASHSMFVAGWNSIARGKSDSCHWKCRRLAGRHCAHSVNIVLCGYVVE